MNQKSLHKFTYNDFMMEVFQNPYMEIYYHPASTWWTHDVEDFLKLTEEELQTQRDQLSAIAEDENQSQERSDMASALLQQLSNVNTSHSIPLAPDKYPLMVTQVSTFITLNFTGRKDLGELGPLMVMSAHHKNCDGILGHSWKDFKDAANYEIDNGPVLNFELIQRVGSMMSGKSTKQIPFVLETPKIQRNDLCPCGSGKKFKQCHGLN